MSRRPEGTGRRVVRWAATAPWFVGAAVLAAGCGVGPKRTLDRSSLEGQIGAELARQYALPPAAVSVACPKGIPAQVGQTFSCSARLDGQDVTLQGAVSSRSGRYTVQPTKAVVALSHARAVLQADIAAQTRAPTVLDCPTVPVLVVPAGGSFRCTATIGGEARTVTVTVIDLQGHVEYTLAPPSSGPGATTAPQTLPAG